MGEKRVVHLLGVRVRVRVRVRVGFRVRVRAGLRLVGAWMASSRVAYISHRSPLDLPYISPTSPVHLP